MYITICPDSFKGSLSANEVASRMAQACFEIFPSAKLTLKPMADGGEGTVEALVKATAGKRILKQVMNALGGKCKAVFGVDQQEETVFIEVANIAGLVQVPQDQRNPFHTTSYGLGEMLIHVLDEGFNKVVIGLGGSATNDGGLGFLQALGAKFFDKKNNEVGFFGRDLIRVSRVDFSQIDRRVYEAEIHVATDVDNPLCGERGASNVFGPQKGATPDQVKQLDRALDNFSQLVEEEVGRRLAKVPGAGAAGGLGFALLSVGAQLVSGAELVAKTIALEESIRESDFVLTGEGKSDEQTLYGKAPGYVAKLAKKHGVPAILISGAVERNKDLQELFLATFSIINRPLTLQDAIKNSDQLLYEQTKNVIKLFGAVT
ncbi:glycerate kinase family protein [Bacillaceae bacterium W0354]